MLAGMGIKDSAIRSFWYCYAEYKQTVSVENGIMQNLSFFNTDTIFLHDQNFGRAILGESFRFVRNRN